MISEEAAKSRQLERWTRWRCQSLAIPTQWGTKMFRDWCSLEGERLRAFHHTPFVVVRKGAMCALYGPRM